MFGGHLAFLSPAILGFLLALPLLWWLLRLTPPSPRKILFPALDLLRGAAMPEKTPARTPWWLLLLRLAIAALVILAFARPVIDPQAVISGGAPVLIIVDNDWAAARHWDATQKNLHALIREAGRGGRKILLLPTALPDDGDDLHVTGPLDAEGAYGEAARIAPEAWGSDWSRAAKLLDNVSASEVFWLSSGLGNTDAKSLYESLKQKAPAHVIADQNDPIYLLQPPEAQDDGIALPVLRAETDSAASVSVIAVGRDGNTLARAQGAFLTGAPRALAVFHLPLDLRNQLARFEVEGARSAGSTLLLDAGWAHHPVGLVGDASELAQHSLLSSLYYIDRALAPYADLHVGSLDDLLKQNVSILILTDNADIKDSQISDLMDWVKRGGILIRFAGARLADALASDQNPKQQELLPVILRSGDRALGGSLSWATPQKLQPFPAASPFRGLDIPEDVTIERQILAEPAQDLTPHTWASLADGTPLVTVRAIGSGTTVLFHVPAQSSWSNLPLSGLFVDMLRRILDLSQGMQADTDIGNLPPYQALNGFGDTQKPGSAAEPLLTKDIAKTEPGPHHPPGLYGSSSFNRAFNLGAALPQPEKISGIPLEAPREEAGQVELQPALLTAALLLFLIDFAVGLYLRGLITLPRRKTAAILLALLLFQHPAQADDTKAAIELTSKTYLAYVITGNREVDQTSEAGLASLAQILQRRTSIDQIAVTGVDPERDELAFFPVIYWPVTATAAPLSPQGAQHVDDYLHHGGMILFDTLTGEKPSPFLVQKALAGIDIPPLEPLPQDHVLKRSFYLLDDFPGRYADADFWVEPESTSSYDGVATVLMGANDWAAAWAADANGRFLFPCTPGGEAQRERAFRFGVNLVMYALTGNYKSDQLHAQELLKRMGR